MHDVWTLWYVTGYVDDPDAQQIRVAGEVRH